MICFVSVVAIRSSLFARLVHKIDIYITRMDAVEKYDGNSNFTHRRKAFRSTTTRGDWGRGLHAQWTSLNWAIFAAHVFGDLCHVLVVGQALGVLELVKVVHNPETRFSHSIVVYSLIYEYNMYTQNKCFRLVHMIHLNGLPGI